MRIDIISFTKRGAELSLRLAGIFGPECALYHKGEAEIPDSRIQPVSGSLRDWTGRRFSEYIPVIFVGALGIAVRSIAPFIEDKLKDIPVVAVDEAGRFSIPVLSAHYGGSLHIAKKAAEGLGAVCVMTTATDINDCFAVDVFAAKNNLIPADKDGIKKISTKILSGESVKLCFEKAKTEGELPKGVELTENADEADVVVSDFAPTRSCTLHLVPQNLHVGVGCKKGKSRGEIFGIIKKVFESNGLNTASIESLASISLKAEEEGIIEAAAELGADFRTFPAEELSELKGEFSHSDFVNSVTGVDNVCERAAVLSAKEAGGGRLIVPKSAHDGVTVAVAAAELTITF